MSVILQQREATREYYVSVQTDFPGGRVEHRLVGDKIGGRASSQAIIQEGKDKPVDNKVSVGLHRMGMESKGQNQQDLGIDWM